MKKGLRLLFIFALLITLVACGDREIPTFDDILNQTVDVGSDAQNWEDLLENLADNETPVEKLIIEVDDNVNYDVPGTYNVTITVTDESDNVASVTFTVSVEDNEKPVITLVGGASISLIAGESFTDLGATFTDNVDGTGNATVSGSVNTAVAGTYTLTYNYTDAAGNAADPVTRTVTVTPLDTQAPVITLTGDAVLTVEAGATFTDPGATFSDNLDGTGAAIASGSVDTSALGSYTLTYNYTDAQGNAATPVTRTVNVVDTTAPVITVAQATYTVEVGSTFSLPTATASDNLDADATVTATGTVDASTVGSYTLTYTHSDSEGNAATAVTVTVVVEDTTAPVVTLTGDAAVTLEAGVTFTDAGATATDNYDATATVVVSGTVNNGALGTYTLTYTSTDASGNVGTATRTVTVVDTTAPVITVTGGENITVQIGETYTELGATFTDNLDAAGNATVATTSDTVDTATVGTYTITYTATDSAGNTSTVTRIVTVSDTPPRLAQYAPEEEDTMSILNYIKMGDFEIFVLNYNAKTLLIIFEGQEVIEEFEFGREQMGPNTPPPTKDFYSNIFRVSEKGLYILTRSFQDFRVTSGILYDLESKEIITSIPQGSLRIYQTGPNQPGNMTLNEFGKYYYFVTTGEDKGIYKFNDDLTLNKITDLVYNFTEISFRTYNDKFAAVELRLFEQSSMITITYILDTVTHTVIETINNSVGNLFVMGEKFGYTYFDSSRENNKNVLKVWSSPTSSETLFVTNLHIFIEGDFFTEVRNPTSLAVSIYDSVEMENELVFYDETFAVTRSHTYSIYAYAVNQNGDYIVILDRDAQFNSYTLKAYKNDGSDPIEADYGMTETFITGDGYFVRSSNYSQSQAFDYIYTIVGNTDGEMTSHKAFYFLNGEFISYDLPLVQVSRQSSAQFSYDGDKLILMHVDVTSDFSVAPFTSESEVSYSIYDFETREVMVTNVQTYDYNIFSTSLRDSSTNGYAVYGFGGEENNFQNIKQLILLNVEDGTFQFGELDTATNSNFINSVDIDGDNIEIFISQQVIKTTITNFLETHTIEMSNGGGGPGGSIYNVENIINDDDLVLEVEFGMEGPVLNITWNGVVFDPISLRESFFDVYVYDAEGTENDTVFIYFALTGIAIDLNDENLTEYQGVITSEGFLSLDNDYNESFGLLPLTKDMFFEYYMYRD